jgi:hypothetical protein
MKKLLLALCLFATGLTFAQRIKIEDNKFYVKDSLVYKHDIKKVLAAKPEALQLYKKAKTRQSIGGVLLASGIGLCVADAVMGLTTENRDYPQALTFTGLGVAAVSIPLLSGNKKRIAKSIELYNEDQPVERHPLGLIYDVKFISNRNGLGLNLTF